MKDTIGPAPMLTIACPANVTKSVRAQRLKQRPCCLWFTGLSGAGKSTLASLTERRLLDAGYLTYHIDGDAFRNGISSDLGFSDADRIENIRRAAHASLLMVDAGLFVLTSFISPFRADRQSARRLFAPGEFHEIFVDTPIEICEARDPKGLYKKARQGLIPHFTGITSPYEPPEEPDIHILGEEGNAKVLSRQIAADLHQIGVIEEPIA